MLFILEIKLKFKFLVVLFSSLLASQAFAECKSVMGTCVKQELVNSAPHMHSDYVEKTKVVPTAPQNQAAASTATNNKNVAKNTTKKSSSTGVFSTMQKPL